MSEESNSNSSAPLFHQSAVDLASKLGAIPTAEAAGMAREARELATTFHSWASQRPENTARIARIRELFDLNRRAMDFLAQRKSGPPSQRR
jgi:hypothetical protein